MNLRREQICVLVALNARAHSGRASESHARAAVAPTEKHGVVFAGLWSCRWLLREGGKTSTDPEMGPFVSRATRLTGENELADGSWGGWLFGCADTRRRHARCHLRTDRHGTRTCHQKPIQLQLMTDSPKVWRPRASRRAEKTN